MKKVNQIFKDRLKQLLQPEKFDYYQAEAVSLWICCPECGWIDARLIVGEDFFPFVFRMYTHHLKILYIGSIV